MQLLFVNACISERGQESRTLKLSRAFLDAYLETHPADTVVTADLSRLPIQPFDREALEARNAKAGQRDFSGPEFQLARDFQSANKIVVAAPFWDLSFPAILRVYIEHISACGLCYHYDEQGCHGDCRAERLAYLTTGGDCEKPESLGALYWKQLAEMFGIPRFDYVFAGGLDVIPEKAPELLEPALEKARKLGREF